MSTAPTASSSSDCTTQSLLTDTASTIHSDPDPLEFIFKKSLEEYKEKTKVDLLTHPLMAKLQACDNIKDFLAVLDAQVETSEKSMSGNPPAGTLARLRGKVEQFKKSTSDDIKSTKWLNPIVYALQSFSSVIGTGAGLVFSPASVICGGAGVLLLAAKDVLESPDALMEIFERIESFFRRLEEYAKALTIKTESMMAVLVKITVEVLGIFAILTKEIKDGKKRKMRYLKNYLKSLIGRADISGTLKKLDRLTNEEFMMAVTEILKSVKCIQSGVEGATRKIDELDRKIVEYQAGTFSTSTKIDELLAELARKFDERWAADQARKAREDEAEKLVAERQKIEEKRKQVRMDRAWLSPPNPTTNQNNKYDNIIKSDRGRATRMRTTTWLTEGDTFVEWKTKPNSFLWIQGKAGSGKSVLCSAVIKNIMELQKDRQATLAYFYFDFNDVKKTNLDNALRSLLTHLAAHSDRYCDILSDVYHNNGGSTPDTDEMITCLDEMLEQPDQGPVYIILDALDECPNADKIPSARTQVLDLLERLVDPRFSKLHLCVTSRPEDDIRSALKAFRAISIHEQAGQYEDIGRYIKDMVYANSNTPMGRWDKETKNMVVNKLSEEADGMFQWVYCQLVVLRHCPQRKVKQTLKELPKDLDKTYERMLKNIAQMPSSDDVIRLLQCLSVAIRPLRVEELAEVLALDFDGPEGAPPELNDPRPLEHRKRDILSFCSSLITLVDNDDFSVIRFSHFSVKEFLTSHRLFNSKEGISQFHIEDEAAHTILAQACLGTLLRLDGSSVFMGYASRHWLEHAQFGTVLSQITIGMRRLFDSAKPYFAAWLKLHDIDNVIDDRWGYKSAGRGSQLYYASLCGFRDLAEHIIGEHPEQVNARGGHRHFPLVVALYNGHDDVVELLRQHAADANASLQVASADGRSDVVRWLLDHGANPYSRQDDRGSPIYLATINGHPEVVPILLRPGAHNNVVVGAADNLVHLATFYASAREYRKKTRQDLLAHPLMAQFQTCNNILSVFRSQVQQTTSCDDILSRCLCSTIHVLHAFSTALASGAGVEQVLPPVNVIFVAAGALFSVVPRGDGQTVLIELFECIENFFRRFELHTHIELVMMKATKAMKGIMVEIMVEVLGMFGTAITIIFSSGISSPKTLTGREDIEDALHRLDILMQRRWWVATQIVVC